MIVGSLARRYGKALMSVAVAADAVEKTGEQMAQLGQVFEDNQDLRTVLTSPIFKISQRKKVLEDLLARHKVLGHVKSFLGLLIEKERIAALPDIARELGAMVDAHLGRVRARVTSAQPLTRDQEARIRTALEQQTGKQVLLEKREDSQLIGGMVTQIGDLIYDGSVKNQLALMKETILKEEQHF